MRFKEFEGEWKRYKISDVLDFFSTNSLSWDQLEYNKGNIYNLHYGLIHKNLPTQIDLKICTLPNIKEGFEPVNYTLCEDGDIVFADASEDINDVGKVVEFLNCADKKVVCGLHTIQGRDRKDLTIVGFKGYAFSSNAIRTQIRKLAQGTKIYSLSPKNFSESYISLPPKEEQAKIARLLLLLDQRISTQIKIIEDLKLLKNAARNEIFNGLQKTCSKIMQIKDILDYEQPTNYMVESTDYSDNFSLIPVLTANKAFILGYTTEKNNVYDKGDCIIFDDFTMDLKYVDFKFKVKSSAIKILTPKKNINLRYIYECISFIDLKPSEHKRHYISEVESINIPITNIENQRNISILFSNIYSKIETESDIYNLLLKQKQYLLQQMFI